MTVVERALQDGRRLFSARSIVPLLLVPVVVLAMPESSRTQDQLGTSGSAFVQWAALAIALAGLALRCATVAFSPDGTSSRDTRGLRAPSLNTKGMYSLVRHPEDFRQWSAATPTFVPRVTHWVGPGVEFQWRRVLSEHNGLLAIVVSFTLLQVLAHSDPGGSGSNWFAGRPGLLYLVAAAVAVSLMCIAFRRLPRTTANSETSVDVST